MGGVSWKQLLRPLIARERPKGFPSVTHQDKIPETNAIGILEQHWNGAIFSNLETMLAWAKTMKWKGIPPIVNLSQKIDHKGVSLTKKALEKIEMRLLRNPHLPKWDILIRPC